MRTFIRFTLLLTLAIALSGCGIRVYRESPVEFTSPVEHLPPANYSPLVSEAVYAAPETAAAFQRKSCSIRSTMSPGARTTSMDVRPARAPSRPGATKFVRTLWMLSAGPIQAPTARANAI